MKAKDVKKMKRDAKRFASREDRYKYIALDTSSIQEGFSAIARGDREIFDMIFFGLNKAYGFYEKHANENHYGLFEITKIDDHGEHYNTLYDGSSDVLMDNALRSFICQDKLHKSVTVVTEAKPAGQTLQWTVSKEYAHHHFFMEDFCIMTENGETYIRVG